MSPRCQPNTVQKSIVSKKIPVFYHFCNEILKKLNSISFPLRKLVQLNVDSALRWQEIQQQHSSVYTNNIRI